MIFSINYFVRYRETLRDDKQWWGWGNVNIQRRNLYIVINWQITIVANMSIYFYFLIMIVNLITFIIDLTNIILCFHLVFVIIFFPLCYFQIITSSLTYSFSHCVIHSRPYFKKLFLYHSRKINLHSFLRSISSSYASLPKNSSYLLMVLSLSSLRPKVHCSSSKMEPCLTLLILVLILLPYH